MTIQVDSQALHAQVSESLSVAQSAGAVVAVPHFHVYLWRTQDLLYITKTLHRLRYEYVRYGLHARGWNALHACLAQAYVRVRCLTGIDHHSPHFSTRKKSATLNGKL